MNTLVLTLALIFLPGIIWARLDAKYASQTKPTQFDLILNVFVFGLIAYVVTYIIYLIPCIQKFAVFNLVALDVDDKKAQSILNENIVDDILVATFVSLVLAPIWLSLKHHKIITRILQKLKVTNRYGDEDVWDFTLNSTEKTTRYVNLRDIRTGVTFSGYVEVFSETPALRELLLRNVCAYDTDSGEPVFEIPRLYLAREPKEITMEFPADSSYEWKDTPKKED